MYAKVVETVKNGELHYLIQVQKARESIRTAKDIFTRVFIGLPNSNHNSLEYFQSVCDKVNQKEIAMGKMIFDDEQFGVDDSFIESDKCMNCNTEYFVGEEEFCIGCGRPITPNYNEDQYDR
jgi:hypothetical protein